MTDVKRKPGKTIVDDKPEDWTVIWCDTTEEIEQCISDTATLWPIIHSTVKRLLSEDRTSLPALEIRCAEMLGSVWVTIRMDEVGETLKREMNFRLDREEYEECAEIRDLMSQWEGRKVPSSVKKSADTDEN
jgi:hypothetical protein